jgi:hypothetical protein
MVPTGSLSDSIAAVLQRGKPVPPNRSQNARAVCGRLDACSGKSDAWGTAVVTRSSAILQRPHGAVATTVKEQQSMSSFKIRWMFALAAVSGPVLAHDYPTMDRVDHVLTCMKQNGGQNVDNMFRCSCEIDVIAQVLSVEDFNTARTFEIYKNMPGEKGSLFRESKDGAAAIDKLVAARKDAEKRCFVGATRQTQKLTEKGVSKTQEKSGAESAK